jgi:fluoroacetyl-CoA thioesterase
MPLPVGANREENVLVTEDMAISFLGPGAARVLSTPHMIGYMEMVSRNLIKEHVAPHEDSVGTLVNVKHLAATPIGMSVRLRSEIVSVNGQRVLCRVEAWDEREKIGEGLHERFVIDVERFSGRVREKSVVR